MNLLIGSLAKDGKLSYYEGNNELWSIDLNCPKFITTDGTYFYSYSQGDKTTLYCFEKDNKSFKVRSTIEIDDTTISHLEFSTKHNMLFISCMDSGNYHGVEVIDGIFTKVLFKELSGNMSGKCHQVLLNKNQDKAVIVNIKQNTLYFYNLNNQSLELTDTWSFDEILPRHLLYSVDEEVLYLVTEKSNEIIVLDYKNKVIIQRQLIDLDVQEKAQGATLQRNNENTILYVNLRGNNTITSFSINKDYKLTRINTFTSYGNNARAILLSKDNKYLLSANIKTNDVTIINTSSYELVDKIEFREAISLLEV